MLFNGLAYAQDAAGAPNAMGGMANFLLLIIIFVIFYFLLIRPQQKKQKQHAAMIDALKSGDTIVTNAGIIGTIHSVDGNVMIIDLGGGTKVRLIKGYIADKIDPATFNAVSDTPNKENK